MLFMFSSCTYGGNYGGKVSDVKTKNVDSKVYSQEDITAAIDTIKNWMWILIRTDGGKWKHVDHGY